VIAEIVPDRPRFPWPKSMRWGAASAKPARCAGCGRCIPSSHLRAGDRGPEVVPFEVDGIAPATSPRPPLPGAGADPVRRFDDYVAKLEKREGRARSERRKEIILADAKHLAFAQGLELVEDEGCWRRSPAWSNGRWC
jgi:glycyl-tRNA synthetase beta chain